MNIKFLFKLLVIILFTNCSEIKKECTVTIKNNLDNPRSFETVEIIVDSLNLRKSLSNNEVLKVLDISNGKEVLSQNVDIDKDGITDIVLIQPTLKSNASKEFKIVKDTVHSLVTQWCYSKFVPERIDDYAWENDKVAFRTFGPKAQFMAENNIEGGTLSSGIDAWLKRVNYPIINKWYYKELKTKGTYHEDTGEGLDNFHVGVSRGVGGIAKKYKGKYIYSKNFKNWKLLYNGPIRTSFILEYEAWGPEKNIKERKLISLDKGNYLSRYEIELSNTDTISVGLTLHENDGKTHFDLKNGFMSYWQPHGDSELGTAVVTGSLKIVGNKKYITDQKDESNLYLQLLVDKASIVYYSGYGWKKNDLFSNDQEWLRYLKKFSKTLKNPLVIRYKN